MESGYKCGNPTCRAVLTLQLHHIEWVRDGGSDDEENLLPLCGHCHDLHTAGHIPKEAIRVWKAALASLNSVNRGTADLLIHLGRMALDPIGHYSVYSAGDLLHLAAIINAGLVSAIGTQAGSGNMGMPPFAVFRVELTERGQDFLAAWKSGREGNLTATLVMNVAKNSPAS